MFTRSPSRNQTTLRSAARRQRAAVLLEALEPRQLLTIDLTGSFLIAPTSVLSGTKQSVSLNVTNSGTTTAKGTLTVSFYAALDGVAFDPGTATFLGKAAWSVSLGAGRSQVLKDSALPISAALPAGTYELYAVLNSNGKFIETDTTNNALESGMLAIAQPNYDLVGSFAPTTLPPAIIAGQNTKATVKVVVTSSSGGTATIASGVTIQLQIVARPVGAADDSQDIQLTAAPVNLALGALAPGKSRTLSVGIKFPSSLAAGDYNLVVKINTSDTLAETNQTNNEGSFAHTIAVAAPFSDPTLGFSAATVIPPGVVADGRALPLKFTVENLGNIKIPSGQTSSVSIVAHNLSTGTDTLLQTFAVSLTGLAPGASKTFTLSPKVAATLATGDYELQATLATTASGDLLANNSAAEATTLVVGPPSYNLAVQTPTSTFNPAIIKGTATSGTISVPIKNLGNSILSAGTLANITLVLRPVGASDSSGDITIGHLSNASLAGLGVGATHTFRIGASIPAAVAKGDYQIVATLATPTLADNSAADNTAIGPTVRVAAPFVDLAVVSATQNFTTPAAAYSTASGTIVLRNMGNVEFQGSINIQFFANASGSVNSSLMGQRSFVVDLQPGATSVPLGQTITANVAQNGAMATVVSVTARIDPAGFTDAASSNNQLSAGTIIVSSQYVDLTLFSATNPFPANASAGATAVAHVLVGNIGSGLGVGSVTVNYYATTTGTIDSNAILLGSLTTNVSLDAAQISPTLNVDLTLPSPSTTTTYKIVAQLAASLAVDNNLANNLTPVLGSAVTVAAASSG